jgi:ketosteroid isomerase-like protein
MCIPAVTVMYPTGALKETMRQFAIITALSLAFACSSRIEQTQVVEAERLRAEAINARDAAAYGRLVSPNLVVTDPDGEVLNRDDRMAAIDSGAASNARRVESDIDVRVYGDLALVLGRSDSQVNGELNRDFFMRAWANQDGALKMVGGHYTRMSEYAVTNSETFGAAERAIEESPIAANAPSRDAEEQVKEAIREQHQAYWSKDPDRYRRFAAADLLRVAENGVSTREQLITGMRANSRLPAPPSDQLDVQVRLFGNAALATWLDQGGDLLGRFSQGRFTVVLVRRGDVWQMVHIQTSGVKRQPAREGAM